MRIAYFTSIYPRATDTFIQREVIYLRDNGFEVFTIALRKPGDSNNVSNLISSERENTHYLLPASLVSLIWVNLITLFTSPFIYFKTLGLAFKTRKPGLKGTAYQLFYFQEALLLARQLVKNKLQHLHNHFGDSSGNVALLASRLSGVGYSMTFHGPHLFFEPTLMALGEKVKYAKFIVCISNYCKSQVMLFSDPKDWHKLHIVHCGVDINSYKELSKDEKLCEPVLQLLYVGRLASEKGVLILLRSLVLLKEEGYQFHLTLLGDGPDRALLEQAVRSYELQEMVSFGGFASQETVKETLNSSDIFILPSFAEGVPVSLMEAMACGIPVIGTNVGGVTELIGHGESGLVVAPSDELALKKAIAEYLDNPSLREDVKKSARSVIEQHFNLSIEVSKLRQLFKDYQES